MIPSMNHVSLSHSSVYRGDHFFALFVFSIRCTRERERGRLSSPLLLSKEEIAFHSSALIVENGWKRKEIAYAVAVLGLLPRAGQLHFSCGRSTLKKILLFGQF